MIAEINTEQLSNLLYNVAWLRGYYGISKRRMAQLLKISVGSLNKLEAGIVPPRLGIEFIFHLHKEFHYPLGTLFHARLPHDIQMP